MRKLFLFTLALSVLSTGAYAGVTINGTEITFSDNTMQATAQVAGPEGPEGPEGPAGSDATVPDGHGGTGNTVTGTDSFIGGGYSNLVTDDRGTIGGGSNNQAGDNAGTTGDAHSAVVGGGWQNTSSAFFSTVGGGRENSASGWNSTVGGGSTNSSDGNGSTVAGGSNNAATGDISAIGGGSQNASDGNTSTIAGGGLNVASGIFSTIAGGYKNSASGTASTVAGGDSNTASGNYSFAAGRKASDGGFNNVFIWGDSGGGTATAANQFNVHASGGIILNGAVQHASDRNLKEGFAFVDARKILDKVVDMPVSTWRFKSEDDSIQHIGPVAQDFMAAFGYGMSDKHITATDADGVALAAIQGLNAKLEEKSTRIDRQEEAITALRWHNEQLLSRLIRLENAILREQE